MCQPQVNRKSVILDQIPCLMAGTSNVRIAIIQPEGELESTDTLGPHYPDADRVYANKRAESFLSLCDHENVDLAISPEYFLPIETVNKIIADPNLLKLNSFYILPIESLKLDVYLSLLNSASNGDANKEVIKTNIDDANLDADRTRYFVNPTMMIYRNTVKTYIFFQIKTIASSLELTNMVIGKEIFSIEGDNIVLVHALCSDANRQPPYDVWGEISLRKPGAYIVHSQFNPKSDYEDYYKSFWASVLNIQDGDNRILFSINWNRNSKINPASAKIDIPSTKIIRGRSMQKNSEYQGLSKTGIHLQIVKFSQTDRRSWEVWHFVPEHNYCQILDLVRPFQGTAEAQAQNNKGVISSKHFIFNNVIFEEKFPQNLTNKFFAYLVNAGLPTGAYSNLKNLTLCELESFSNACLARNKDEWLSDEIDSRIPTAFNFCTGKRCVEDQCQHINKSCCQKRRYWEEDANNVKECLESFYNCTFHKDDGFELKLTDQYPLNVIQEVKNETGWLFHCKGASARSVGKRVIALLSVTGLSSVKKDISLFPIRVFGDLKPEIDFVEKPQDISEPGTGVEVDNSKHKSNIKVCSIENLGV